MKVTSNEHGEKDFHGSVTDFCFDHINNNYKDKLCPGRDGVISLGLGGDGNAWKIDLSNIKISPQLTEKNFSGFLTE